MKFKVTGADITSGEDVVQFFDAQTHGDATRSAQAAGIAIESVEEIAWPSGSSAPRDYFAVYVCGGVLFFAGIVSILAGVVLVLVAVNPVTPETSGRIGYAIATAFIGIFQLGLGSLLHMLRDTAIHIQSK